MNKKAQKEIEKFPKPVRIKFTAYLETLEEQGKLEKPFAKKISKDLYEIRVKYRGEWRAIYAYLLKNTVVVLSAFRKKTVKAPIKEINKAQRRLKEH
ncbi:MAG: type II toxin-antitoxin system RelE/ParE family toxin [Patescibacteria group bacterium]